MKTKIVFKAILIIVLAFFVNNAFSQTLQGTFNQPGTITVTKGQYQNNLYWKWEIDFQANEPLILGYNVDIEYNYDFIDILEVDNSGVITQRIAILTGACSGLVSTNLSTGKARVIFYTDASICGDKGYTGFSISFNYASIDNQFIDNNLYVGNNVLVNNNLSINNKLTVNGNLIQTNAGGSKVVQTLNSGYYKIDVNASPSSSEYSDYRVAIRGQDKFRIMPWLENYSLGTGALNSISGIVNSQGGAYNIAIGYNALYSNGNGAQNVALGFSALSDNSGGSLNIGIGYQAGRYIANGSTGNTQTNKSIFLGAGTKAQADGQTNQIVIGYNAIGNGSNTVTIGNDEIEKTILKGKVGIGTTNPSQEFLLDVKGAFRATDIVAEDISKFADFVFDRDYRLPALTEVDQFIKENGRLPDIPSEAEVKEKGLNLVEMQVKLLQKIEELMLYTIQQQEMIDKLNAKIEKLENNKK